MGEEKRSGGRIFCNKKKSLGEAARNASLPKQNSEKRRAEIVTDRGTGMTNEEKIFAIQHTLDHPDSEDAYYRLLENIGGLKRNYWDYMITEPIDCDKELERLPDADYELCTALLTMILREDHFSNGYLQVRYEAGQVDAILNRMIETLKF